MDEMEENRHVFTVLKNPSLYRIVEWFGNEGGVKEGKSSVLYKPLARYLLEYDISPMALHYALTRLKDEYGIIKRDSDGRWLLTDLGWKAYFIGKVFEGLLGADFSPKEYPKLLRKFQEYIETEAKNKEPN